MMPLKKTSFRYLAALTSICLIILLYYRQDSIFEIWPERSMNTDQFDESMNDIQILIWTPFLHPKDCDWDHIFQRLISKQCPESRCKLTYDRTQYKTADAVLFSLHFMNIYNNYQVPPIHHVDQPWILLSFEASLSFSNRVIQAPKLTRLGLNWTMHFRQDSDILAPYGAIYQIDDRTNNLDHTQEDIWSRKDKNKTAAWMVSHCETPSERETYVKELQKHIRVDIYGKCGNLKCGFPTWIDKRDEWNTVECSDVMNGYLFYVAFENRICSDYVTEKFYRSLRQDIIPVVMGGADYSKIAPPYSYIDALDFPTPTHLAKYLKKVASDPVLYNKYFEWKSYYIVDIGFPYSPMICNLCEKLHQHRYNNQSGTSKSNLSEWFINDGCQGSWEQVNNLRL